MERFQGSLALEASPATGSRRIMAGIIDCVVALMLGLMLTGTAGRWFASQAVSALRIGQPDSLWTGAGPMALGAVGDLVYGLPFALTLILLAEPLTGSTPGKGLMRLAIAPSAGFGRRALRFLFRGVGAWSLTLAIASGSWPLTVASCVASVLSILGMVPAAFGRLALHDRLSNTFVVRRF